MTMSWNRGRQKQDLAGEPGKVYAAALRALARRDHSEHELRQKLYDRGADSDMVDIAIGRLRGYGYLDEQRIAENIIHYHCNFKPSGRALLRRKLAEKGIGEEYIEQAMDEYYTEYDEQSALAALVVKEMASFFGDSASTGEKEDDSAEYAEQKNKKMLSLVRRLERRGFPPAMIWKEITKVRD